MEMTPGEIIDKYTIAKLCIKNLEKDREGIEVFEAEIVRLKREFPAILWDELINIMYGINGFIWGFEEPIHMGRLDEEPIMAGILSVRVRKLNVIRVGLGRMIDKMTGKARKGE